MISRLCHKRKCGHSNGNINIGIMNTNSHSNILSTITSIISTAGTTTIKTTITTSPTGTTIVVGSRTYPALPSPRHKNFCLFKDKISLLCPYIHLMWNMSSLYSDIPVWRSFLQQTSECLLLPLISNTI